MCTGNSARSQMAEAFLRTFAPESFEAYSAGVDPVEVNLLSIKVMKEIGIDISRQKSKSVKEFAAQAFDYVVTVCDNARKSCPIFPGEHKKIHWDIDDPASAKGSEQEKTFYFKNIRDIIKGCIISFIRENEKR